MGNVVKIGILKVGCLGILPLLEFILDERADRMDIDVRVVGAGAKLGVDQCREAAEFMLKISPDVVILVGPGQTTPGPSEARKVLKTAGLPTIIISDSPAKKLVKELEEYGMGYIIVEADSMIGARREFLDPAEMVIFNSDVLKVLAVTGVVNAIVKVIDEMIKQLRSGQKPSMPRVILDSETAVEAAGFLNPYARAKAKAAYELAAQVSKITTDACFRITDANVYIPMVAEAHEIMRYAARVADEAREIEKMGDHVLRRPHLKDGSMGEKRKLMEKPSRINP
ncbi:MAG: F420-dependent methylenetetrahydromethanopterin dehydrogenase [Nitrososphaerota archaeon]|nr:F420-dependent methylenetetrahydromethanopterin dehydrogenase [Candidatus Bathyarchaeota archaeon]MDW8048634.1 F420-dependent methylenetetrahydromethanopterin dehydrogenase [Nitrososphaerota archaeon]